MRTTVTLDPDVAEKLRQLMKERDITFKEAVNSTLRKGLGNGGEARPYVIKPRPLGLKPGIDGDRIVHFLDELDDRERLEKMGHDL
ncbi:MAG: antitoxin [Actinomycetota bacterium]